MKTLGSLGKIRVGRVTGNTQSYVFGLRTSNYSSSDDEGTGLYLALDILYAQANAESYVNPVEIARQICSQRGNLIQTKASIIVY